LKVWTQRKQKQNKIFVSVVLWVPRGMFFTAVVELAFIDAVMLIYESVCYNFQ